MRTRDLTIVIACLIVGLVYVMAPALDTATPQANSQEGTVFVPVNVTDSKNVPVTTLKAEHFQILEENKEQKITSVSIPGDPMTLGLGLQLSTRGPVKTQGQRDRVTVDILGSLDRIREAHGAGLPPTLDQLPLDSDGHYTMLANSIAVLDRQATRRKALVVVSDGLIAAGSSAESMQPPKNLIELAKRVQFPIYFLFVVTSIPEPALTEGSTYVAGYTLQQMAEASGGQMFVGQVENNLASSATKLRDMLKSQYVLGFTSTNAAKDGKWRKLTVKVNPPAELTKLKVAAKSRYFVPKADGAD